MDHIIVSPGMLKPCNFSVKKDSARTVIVTDDQLFDPKGDAIPRPNRSYSGNQFHPSGYSDHLPVRAILNY